MAVQRAALVDLQDLVTSGSGWEIFSHTLPTLFRKALDELELDCVLANTLSSELEQTSESRFEEIEEKYSSCQRSDDGEGQVVVGVSLSMNSLRRRGWGKDIRTRGSKMGQS